MPQVIEQALCAPGDLCVVYLEKEETEAELSVP